MPKSGDRFADAHLVLDFGGVLTTPQPSDTITRLAAIAGADPARFAQGYWRLRDEYDRGLSAADYWAGVLPGQRLTGDVVDRLTRTDIASWVGLDDDSLAVVLRARDEGCTLHLLSNAPHAQAEHVRDHELLGALFDTMTFSCDLGMIKPEPAIYAHVLRLLAPLGGRMAFVDDRVANVHGALAAGLDAVLFESAEAFESWLGNWLRTGPLAP